MGEYVSWDWWVQQPGSGDEHMFSLSSGVSGFTIDQGNWPYPRWDYPPLFSYHRNPQPDYGGNETNRFPWATLGFQVVDPSGPVRQLVVPDYALFLTFALLPLFRWRGVFRQRHAGSCPACGYDLRATTDRCPECGTPIKTSHC